MKNALFIAALCLAACLQGCGSKPVETVAVQLDQPTVVEAACGHCQFGLKGAKGCSLAIRHEGASYAVDGFKLTDLGDPHAPDGLCNKVHKAKVTGQIAKGRFAASSFDLLPAENP